MSGWSPAINLLKQAGGIQGTRTNESAEKSRHPMESLLQGKIRALLRRGRIKDGESSNECLKYLSHNASTFNPILSGENQNHAYPIFHHAKERSSWTLTRTSLKDIKTSLNEGFDSVELLKRFTTLGMGPSQGKTSSVNGNRIMANSGYTRSHRWNDYSETICSSSPYWTPSRTENKKQKRTQ